MVYIIISQNKSIIVIKARNSVIVSVISIFILISYKNFRQDLKAVSDVYHLKKFDPSPFCESPRTFCKKYRTFDVSFLLCES